MVSLDRRGFLLSTGALIATGHAANPQSMPGMSMPGMPRSAPTAPSRPILIMPEGEELRPLTKLAPRSGPRGIFSTTLVAAPAKVELARGIRTEVLAYNGLVPGPLIEVNDGDRVEIDFMNHILGQESTIHWHGLPVPPDQDGNPMDPVLSQTMRRYAFDLPEDSAGSYWYHPHPDKYTPEQVFRGLAGAFVVKPKVDPLPSGLGDTILFISDLRLDADGTVPPNTQSDWKNGREGDYILVNGQKRPRLVVNPGASRRFRLYNASNARYLRLGFAGHQMTLIGTDGGFLEAPVPGIREVLLAPAERAEVVVDFRATPGQVSLEALPYDRGWMEGPKPSFEATPILTIELAGPPHAAVQLPARLREIKDLGLPVSRKRLVFGERMSMGSGGSDVEFLIDGRPFELGRVDLVSRINEVELWEISNPTDMDHPLHVHGSQFQIVERERNGRTALEPVRAWKDTVNVAKGETVRFKIRQDRPGLLVYHCHILEHEEKGMMGTLQVS